MLCYQCTLERKEDNKKCFMISWIPEKFANVGRILKLQNRQTGEWSDGWFVKHVSSFSKESSDVIERSQDYKKHRGYSDI